TLRLVSDLSLTRNTVCVLMTRHNEVVRELLLHTELVDGLPHFAVGVGACSATTTRSPNTPAASRRPPARPQSIGLSALNCLGLSSKNLCVLISVWLFARSGGCVSAS